MNTLVDVKVRVGRLLLCVTTLLLGISDGWADKPLVTQVPQQKLKPFLKTYCLDCHGPDEQNGQLRFDQVEWQINNNDTAQRWQDVLDVLNGGDMPPEEATQPPPAELARVLDTLTGTLLTARKRLTDHGGEITMRRLNRREYVNTIRHLFGFHIAADLVPEDGEAELFDTVGQDQFFTSDHFEKYLELGRKITAWGFQWSGKPFRRVDTNRREPEGRVTKSLRETLADLDRKMEMKLAGKTWQEMGFKDAGEAEIVFRQFDRRAGHPRKYLQYPHVEQGIYMCEVNNSTRRFGMNRGIDPRGRYLFRVRAGVVGEPPQMRQFLRFSDNTGTVGSVRVLGTPDKPENVELLVPAKLPYLVQSFHVQENRADIRVLESYLRRLDPDGEWAAIWIDWLEMEGPYYDTKQPVSFFGKLLYPQGYVHGKPSPLFVKNRAREFVERFAFEAFRRRQPSSDYVDGLMKLFESNRAAGLSFQDAMAEVLAVVLASPEFLYLAETPARASLKDVATPEVAEDSQPSAQQPTNPRRLSAHEFASRLSYFLWSSPPDEQLYQLAADETLFDPQVLRTQVDRMLNDSRAESFFRGFMHQWADLSRFDAITVDEEKFFRFNKGIRHAAAQEVGEFFRILVTEDLPIKNMVSSDFIAANSLLAEHYGIAGVTSDKFAKVKLPAESPRGGLMTQTAFLVAGSNGERSSPVIRGAMVMEKIMHDKPAPPPPNVPELGASATGPTTNRQLVELHQKQAVCASCHKKMDVIGFGLENFDPIGRWRTTEKIGRKQVAIEPGGVLPGGLKFDDVHGLKSVLLQQDKSVAIEVVEAMLAYGMGRTIEFSDADAVDKIIAALQPKQYSTRSMIHEIVRSSTFQSK